MTTGFLQSQDVCRHLLVQTDEPSTTSSWCHCCVACGSFPERTCRAAGPHMPQDTQLHVDLTFLFITIWQNFSLEVCCECKRRKIFFLMYKSWFFGAGFYSRMVFTCSVFFFFSTFFIRTGVFKKEMETF